MSDTKPSDSPFGIEQFRAIWAEHNRTRTALRWLFVVQTVQLVAIVVLIRQAVSP